MDMTRTRLASFARYNITATNFLTRMGKMCAPIRQEFVLLSNALGISVIVDALNNPPSRNRDGQKCPGAILLG